jgi:hypothetical protein
MQRIGDREQENTKNVNTIIPKTFN